MHNKKTVLDFDEWLHPFKDDILAQQNYLLHARNHILDGKSPGEFALGWHYFGLHKKPDGWIMREWAPNATAIYLVCEKNNWQDSPDYEFEPKKDGQWQLKLSLKLLNHGDKYKLHIYWNHGRNDGYRLPAYANYVLQNEETKGFDAIVWQPKNQYIWRYKTPPLPETPLIYEAHIGMASTDEKVASYSEFTKNVLPRIKYLGYNTVQLMAIAEHPYYGSFGYHVANFFAPSSRFGTPDDLKQLIDTAHSLGLRVIMDIVHAHSVSNENEGLGNFAGDKSQYFCAGERGRHSQWDSLVFDYGKPEVVHFLLSNVRYWLDEFRFDGFRFDGVTSMIYSHHGLGKSFTSYNDYYNNTLQLDALAYLQMANDVAHSVGKSILTIAEDTSALPGLALPGKNGGIGFDYRLSMGVPDLWIKILKEKKDEDWDLVHLFYELTARRPEEKVISYAESHDQAMVGDKTIMFRLADKTMYWHMQKSDNNIEIERAIALHKMIRLITASTNGGGYLNFMGNEFGHPEWIDFPREGNKWSFAHARRRWDLVDNGFLKYEWLYNFDKAMIKIISDSSKYTVQNTYINQNDGVISFVRGEYLFIFNFSPSKSHEDYGIPTKDGDYNLILSSDDDTFGGLNRIQDNGNYIAKDNLIKIYTPARTACIFKLK